MNAMPPQSAGMTAAMPRTLYIFDQGLKGLVGHYYEYVRSIVEAAEAQGIRCVVGCHEQAGDGSFASFELHPVFRDDVWATVPGEDYHSAASMNGVSARFLEDVHKVLGKYPISPGDMIFLPNIAKPHVVAAALVAETLGPQGARMHFMFRYPASHFDGQTATEAFRRLEAVAGGFDVSLCTDSHRLADNLASLSSLPFAVLPIPHTWHGPNGQPETHSPGAYTAPDPDRPLHCVSLGNARDEKGMAEILEAVRLSAREPWGENLRFTLQVNDPYQVEDAIEDFRKAPPDHRTTLIEEPLSSEEYAKLVESADVVLVPYWRSIYIERTSGVFLEGLVNGKLVVCTRDTWMSDLFDMHGGGVAVEDRSGPAIAEGLRKLLEHRDDLQERARNAAQYWRTVHCPENLVAQITGTGSQAVQPRTKRGNAAVIFPWGEAVAGNTGASLRLKYFVRHMETVYDEVRVLFTGGNEAGGIIGKRSKAEVVHYSEKATQIHQHLKAVCRDFGAPEEDCFHLWFHLWPAQDKVFALRCEEMVLWANHVYVDYTYFAPVIDQLCRKYGKDYTLTFHDIVSDQSLGTPFLNQATRSLEFDAARRAGRVVCASSADQAELEREGVQAEIIPHPIDTQEAVSPFSDDEARAVLRDLYDLPLEGRRLCFFVGSFYPPNVEAAEAIVEMARQCRSDPRLRDVLFVMAGSCMKPMRTENCVALGRIEHGALSACMALAEIVLVPLKRGTGVSLKSIEGLARGSLLLSTSVGMRGLDVVDGTHCRIEDDLSLYPERIAEILADSDGSQRMREAALHFGKKFDFRHVMALYVDDTPSVEELRETPAEFAARRKEAIRELLPRMRQAQKLSPVIAGWPAEYDDACPPVGKSSPATQDALSVATGGWTDASADPASASAVDAAWYLSVYPDVGMLGMDPAEHYAWIGRALGRAPNAAAQKKTAFERRLTTSATTPTERDPARTESHSAASARQRRWFLADPSLLDNSGHCARYLLSLAPSLRQRGDDVHVLGNRQMNDGGDLAGFEPAFTLRCEDTPFIPGVDPASPSGAGKISQRRNDLLRNDLNNVHANHQLTCADIVLINSLRHWSLDAIVEWLEDLDPGQVPIVVLVLHYTAFPQPDAPGPTTDVYRQAFSRIRTSAVGGRIVLCTDSERLAAEYQSLVDVPITVLPIPHAPQPPLAGRDNDRELTIAFAGEARKDKGFHLLPSAVRSVLNHETGRNTVFRLQAYCGTPGDEANRIARDEMPQSKAVQFLGAPLNEAEYERFIAEADLILIPYLREAYHAQTSGVYCEAASLGTPVVVPEGTWMADQVAINGGGVLFEPGNSASLAAACIEAIKNYPALRDQALQAAPAWQSFHNATNFISRLDCAIANLESC